MKYHDNNKQIFNTLPLNITIYSLEVCNIHRGVAEVNIIIPRVNKFDIQRKGIEYLFYYIPPNTAHKNNSYDNAFLNTIHSVFYKKRETRYSIFDVNDNNKTMQYHPSRAM